MNHQAFLSFEVPLGDHQVPFEEPWAFRQDPSVGPWVCRQGPFEALLGHGGMDPAFQEGLVDVVRGLLHMGEVEVPGPAAYYLLSFEGLMMLSSW